MSTTFLLIWYVVLLSFLIAFLYVMGTYLLLAYDRCLARNHLISPGYFERAPRGWTLAKGVTLEVLSTWAVIWLYLPGLISRHPWKNTRKQGRPILLIHGYKHNQSAWPLFRRRLLRAGFGPIYSLTLRPQGKGIPGYAEQVAQLAEKIERAHNQHQIILIGHSLGGLVAAYYAEVLAPPSKVSHLITMGTPLQGTRISVLNFGRTARQMRPGSSFLRDLEWRISSDGFTRYHHIATRFDNIIFPYQSALLPCDARYQLTLPWQGHMTLLFSKTVSRQVIYWLQAAAVERLSRAPHSPQKRAHLPA